MTETERYKLGFSVAPSEGRITDKALKRPHWIGVFFVRHETSSRTSLTKADTYTSDLYAFLPISKCLLLQELAAAVSHAMLGPSLMCSSASSPHRRWRSK